MILSVEIIVLYLSLKFRHAKNHLRINYKLLIECFFYPLKVQVPYIFCIKG